MQEREGGSCPGISPIDLRACVIYISWSFPNIYIYVNMLVGLNYAQEREGGSCLVGWAEVGIFGAKVRCGRSLKSVTGRQQQTTDGRVTISIFIILILNLPILEVSFFSGQVIL